MFSSDDESEKRAALQYYLMKKYPERFARGSEESFNAAPAPIDNPSPPPAADVGQSRKSWEDEFKSASGDNERIDDARSAQSRAQTVGMLGDALASGLTAAGRARGDGPVDSGFFKQVGGAKDADVANAQQDKKDRLSSILTREGMSDRQTNRDFQAQSRPLDLKAKKNTLRNQNQQFDFDKSANPMRLEGLGSQNRAASAAADVAEGTKDSKISQSKSEAEKSGLDVKTARIDLTNKSALQQSGSVESMALVVATDTQVDLDAKALEQVGDKPAADRLRANWERFKTRSPNAVQTSLFAKSNGLDTGKIAALAKSGKTVSKDGFDMEEKLRDNYTKDPVSKNTSVVRQSYSQVEVLANPRGQPTPSDDLALVFNFMKSLDPGSTVREGEFAQAAKVGGLPQEVQAYASQVIGNGRLTPEQRKQLLGTAKKAYDRQTELQSQTDAKHRTLAKSYGLNDGRIVTGFDAAPTTGSGGKGGAGGSAPKGMHGSDLP